MFSYNAIDLDANFVHNYNTFYLFYVIYYIYLPFLLFFHIRIDFNLNITSRYDIEVLFV